MVRERHLPEFTTERLRLRGLRGDDAEFLVSLDTDPRVMEHIHDGVMSREDAEKFAESVIYLNRLRFHAGRWIVEQRATGEKIGWVELHKLSGRERDDLQIAYEFRPEHWGRGFATEAANALLRYALDPAQLDLDCVAAVVRATNAASIRLLLRCGFVKTDGEVWDDAGPCQLWYRYQPVQEASDGK